MPTRPTALVIAAALSQLVGCVSSEVAPTRAADCKPTGNDKDCTVKVIVSESTGRCTVTVDPSLIEIAFPRGVQNKFIHWEISGPAGYVFPDNGIAIDGNMPPDFDKPKVFDHGRKFQWRNLHKRPDPTVYYYSVVVEKSDGSVPPCFQDPKINNQ